MATSDHMKALLRAFTQQDSADFMAAAKELIAEERQKGHNLLAADLERILSNNGLRPVPHAVPYDVPMDRERGLPLAHIERPDLGWERVILQEELTSALQNVVEEFRKREVFRSYGLPPKRKLLFFGPPGCGKTITARVMAGVLDLPLLYVRFDSVVSSYLGETAANLRRVFEFATRGSWLILFDEFDAIGKARDNEFEHGELKRVVNTLLQLMDGFTGDSLLIAATNHQFLLDSAIWRRFDEICRFEFPSVDERARLLLHFISGFRHPDINAEKIAKRMTRMTGDDIERACVDAVKRTILEGRAEVCERDVIVGIKLQKKRMKFSELGSVGPEHGGQRDDA